MDWIRRRLPNNAKHDPETVYGAAVAAAAFSIHSLEESDSLGNKNGNKKDALIKQQRSGELIKRRPFKETNADEYIAKLPSTPNRKTPERAYSARKLVSNASSNKLQNPNDASEKDKRNGKLKSFSWWRNGKKGKISS